MVLSPAKEKKKKNRASPGGLGVHVENPDPPRGLGRIQGPIKWRKYDEPEPPTLQLLLCPRSREEGKYHLLQVLSFNTLVPCLAAWKKTMSLLSWEISVTWYMILFPSMIFPYLSESKRLCHVPVGFWQLLTWRSANFKPHSKTFNSSHLQHLESSAISVWRPLIIFSCDTRLGLLVKKYQLDIKQQFILHLKQVFFFTSWRKLDLSWNKCTLWQF